MSKTTPSTPRARRIRNALLASAFTVGVLGATGTGMLLADGQVAIAQPVEVQQTQVPADFTKVVATVKPAVVAVQVRTEAAQVTMRGGARGMPDMENVPPELREFFRRFGGPEGFDFGSPDRQQPDRRRGTSQGSGFFISEDGYLVTNNHVVEGGKEITVVMDDGSEHEAELIGTDARTDLALLKVEGDGFTYVKFSQEEPQIGAWAIAVGNPFGLGGSVTAGIVSAHGRDIGAGPYDDFLQIDTAVNRGNSGGPTFNTQGEVIGVNTAIFSPSGGNVGIAFAIPARMVQEVVADLKEDGSVTRGWLGVQIQPVTQDIADSLGVDSTDGAIVADAQAGSPADEAGIEAGDIITAVNGNEVADPRELSQTIAGMDPKQKVAITVLRDGSSREIEVTLGNLDELDETLQANAGAPDEDGGASPGSLAGLGLSVEPNPDGDGVVVTGIEDDGPAAGKGLRAGDVIVSVGGTAVADIGDVEAGIATAEEEGRGAVLFKVEGENGTRFVGVPFERG